MPEEETKTPKPSEQAAESDSKPDAEPAAEPAPSTAAPSTPAPAAPVAPAPQAAPAPQEPAKSGGGFFRFVVVVAVIAGGIWAYDAGHLDPYLPQMRAPSEIPPAGVAGSDYIVSGQPVQQPAPAVQAADLTPPPPPPDYGAIVEQLAALETRIGSSESNIQQVSRVLESIADELAANGGRAGEVGSFDAAGLNTLKRLQLEMIDMRLRLTGDAPQADFDLALLTQTLAPESGLHSLISVNRQNLAGMPPRNGLLARLEDITTNAAAIVANAESDIQEKAQTKADSLVDKLFRVRDLAEVEPPEIKIAERISVLSEYAMQALILYNRTQYLETISLLDRAATELSDTAPSGYSLELARIVVELGTFGYPEYSLQLTEPG